MLQLAPLSFDAATFEIWGAAAQRCVPGDHAARDRVSVEEIGEVLIRHQVNTLWLTAGLFERVVDDALRALAGVRQLLVGGDVVSVSHVRQVQRAHRRLSGHQRLRADGEHYLYAAAIGVPADADLAGGVPIGAPI